MIAVIARVIVNELISNFSIESLFIMNKYVNKWVWDDIYCNNRENFYDNNRIKTTYQRNH